LQFPVRITFAVTINQTQGKSLQVVDWIWKIHASHMDSFM
jgi:hypothetical protein